MSYDKITPGHCDWERLVATRANGEWMCDATDHNESGGCSNPTCANWNEERDQLLLRRIHEASKATSMAVAAAFYELSKIQDDGVKEEVRKIIKTAIAAAIGKL